MLRKLRTGSKQQLNRNHPTRLLYYWPVINVVCYERVCCKQVCFEREPFYIFTFLLTCTYRRQNSWSATKHRESFWLLRTGDRLLKNKRWNNAPATWPITRGEGRRGRIPPRNFFSPPGKMCWTYFKTIGHSLKKCVPLSENSSLPWCPKLVTGLPAATAIGHCHTGALENNGGKMNICKNTSDLWSDWMKKN